MSKSLPVLPAVVLLAAGAMGCSGGRSQQFPASGRYLNDGDAEQIADHDADNGSPTHEDNDADSVEEYEHTDNNVRYHDSDDRATLSLGRPASPAETRAIATAVKSYYRAAAEQDGARTCSMMPRTFAKAVPVDYGRRSAGPSYLRAATTCPGVMSLLFRHYRRQLAGGIAVTGVRITTGNDVFALLGSPTSPSSYIAVTDAGGAWKIDALLARPLP